MHMKFFFRYIFSFFINFFLSFAVSAYIVNISISFYNFGFKDWDGFDAYDIILGKLFYYLCLLSILASYIWTKKTYEKIAEGQKQLDNSFGKIKND